MISSNRSNWLDSLNRQVDFYQRANLRCRTDSDFPWAWVTGRTRSPVKIVRKLATQALHMLGWDLPRQEWLNSNAEQLWETRSLISDELSRLLFDATLVLRSTGHQKFYFPRLEFDDLVEIVDVKPFNHPDFPREFVGIPLNLFDIRLKGHPTAVPIQMVAYKEYFSLLNSYRQYLIRRDSFDFTPVPGDIVLDCGACTGDMSLLFAGLVAAHGEVHLFDPIPLHVRYCRLQASLNPSLAHIFHINELAVSNRTCVTTGNKSDSTKIEPGGIAIDSFSSTRLDDYAHGKLSRVDFIKMDIEGAELDAIDGAAGVIREFKPRLAISSYHRPDDLWEIPIRLKSLNPDYNLYFGHHSPVSWESVFYAIQP